MNFYPKILSQNNVQDNMKENVNMKDKNLLKWIHYKR